MRLIVILLTLFGVSCGSPAIPPPPSAEPDTKFEVVTWEWLRGGGTIKVFRHKKSGACFISYSWDNIRQVDKEVCE